MLPTRRRDKPFRSRIVECGLWNFEPTRESAIRNPQLSLFQVTCANKLPHRTSRKQSAALLCVGDALDAERQGGEAAAEFEFPLLVFDRVFRLIEDGEEFFQHFVAIPVEAREIL